MSKTKMSVRSEAIEYARQREAISLDDDFARGCQIVVNTLRRGHAAYDGHTEKYLFERTLEGLESGELIITFANRKNYES